MGCEEFSDDEDVETGETTCRPPCDCEAAMRQINDEVNQIARIPGAIDRNAAITQAYKNLGQAWPDNWWIRLAGYVSTQGGCAMKKVIAGKKVASLAAQHPDPRISIPARYAANQLSKSLNALVDANTTIFSSVYPPNAFAQRCGYARLKECAESRKIDVSPKLLDALEKLENGDLRGAADSMAAYEQTEVVQPVYERHAEAFEFMESVENVLPGDQTSIPVSYQCGAEPVVPLGGLDISDPRDRVNYYHSLMNRMMQVEGLP